MQRQNTKTQKLQLKIEVPSRSYQLEFESVYESNDNKIIAILNLETGDASSEAIANVSAEMEITQDELYAKRVKYYVLTTDKLDSTYLQNRNFTAINNLSAIQSKLAGLRCIYEKPQAELIACYTND